jgi:hypothetical protein
MEIGIYTFVEATPDPVTGKRIDPVQRMRDLMEEIELADQVGLEVFGLANITGKEYSFPHRQLYLLPPQQKLKTFANECGHGT